VFSKCSRCGGEGFLRSLGDAGIEKGRSRRS
jgi:hypothetical protein